MYLSAKLRHPTMAFLVAVSTAMALTTDSIATCVDSQTGTQLAECLERRMASLQTEIENLRSDALPGAAVIGVVDDICPNGWTPFIPSFGRFPRGIDLSQANIDPDGRRKAGSIQSDGFKKHDHGGGDHRHNVKVDLGGEGPNGPRTGSARGYVLSEPSGKIVLDAGGAETRPKNFALLYCVRE